VVEVKCPVPVDERKSNAEKWRLEGRWVEAQVFVSRGGRGEIGAVKWELGEAISGAYEVDDGEIEVVDCWGKVDHGFSEDEGEWETASLTLDGESEWAGPVVWGGSGREVDVKNIEW
jgi:hypothetical protein